MADWAEQYLVRRKGTMNWGVLKVAFFGSVGKVIGIFKLVVAVESFSTLLDLISI
jgi:hypothetical protein